MAQLTDIRVSRTKELLKNALVELMQSTNAKCISVQRLTTSAKISRVTFYRHYQGMPDFLLQTIDGALTGLFIEPETETFQLKENAVRYYANFFNHIGENSDLFAAMLGPNGIVEFRQRFTFLRRKFHDRMMANFRSQFTSMLDDEILHAYFSSALFGLIEYWLTSGSRYTAEYMAEQVYNIAHRQVLRKVLP